MPLPEGTRYRIKTTNKGKKIRLAFLGNRVIEAKNQSSGATHNPSEFRMDRKRRSGMY